MNGIQVELGDVVQVDGGAMIVDDVNSLRAKGIMLRGTKRSECDAQLSRSRIIERRGKAGLEEFLESRKAKRPGHFKLEQGNVLVIENHEWTVIAVSGAQAYIAMATGEARTEDRVVNEFLLAKPQPADLQKNLEQFLTGNHLTVEELAKKATEQPMAKKAATPRKRKSASTTESGTAAAKPAKAEKAKSFAGISEYIAKKVGEGLTGDDLLTAVRAKYPGSGRKWILDRAKKAAKEGKAETTAAS